VITKKIEVVTSDISEEARERELEARTLSQDVKDTKRTLNTTEQSLKRSIIDTEQRATRANEQTESKINGIATGLSGEINANNSALNTRINTSDKASATSDEVLKSDFTTADAELTNSLSTTKSDLQQKDSLEEVARINSDSSLQNGINLNQDRIKKLEDDYMLLSASIDLINEREKQKIGGYFFTTDVTCPPWAIMANGDYVDAGAYPDLNLVRTPDLRDRYFIGWDRDSARNINSFEAGSLASHNHAYTDATRQGNAGIVYYAAISNGSAVAAGFPTGSQTLATTTSGNGRNTVDDIAINICIMAE